MCELFISIALSLVPTPAEYQWAELVLNSPYGTKEPLPINPNHAAHILKYWAVQHQVLDIQYAQWIFQDNGYNYQEAVDLIRDHIIDMKHLPFQEEAQCLPSLDTCIFIMILNRQMDSYLRERIKLDTTNADIIRNIINENDKIYEIWNLTRDAKYGSSVYTRRESLYKLKKEMANDPLYFLKLPGAIPYWRFYGEIPNFQQGK